MASATTTTLDAVLKVYYDDQKVNTLRYSESVVFAMLARMTKFGGKNYPLPIVYNAPTGRNPTIAGAQAAANPSRSEDFVLTRVKDFGVVTISNEALEASEMGDKSAFLSARVTEIDGIMSTLVRSISTALFGTGSGSIANAGTPSTTSLPLSDPEQIINFELGDEISASATDTATPRTGTATVTAIDYDTGVLTSDSNWTVQISGLIAGDFLQVSGDLNAKLTGFAGWIPASAPSATPFFGVDRSVSPNRLGGIRVPTTIAPPGLALEEKILRAVARVAREGSKPDMFVLNHAKWADLQSSLGTRVHFGEVKSHDGSFGFRSIQIMSGSTVVDVVADSYCPSAVGYILQKDTWKLYSLGDVPRFENGDGLMMLRLGADDGVEVRAKYYAQLGCNAPGKNGRVAL